MRSYKHTEERPDAVPASCPPIDQLERLAADQLARLGADKVLDSGKERLEAHLRGCNYCQAVIDAIKNSVAGRDQLKQPSTAVPRHITDLPYVLGVQDITTCITRAYTPGRLTVESILVIAPDFYKVPVLPTGLLPQQYLMRIITALAEILPRKDVLTVDANAASFIIASIATHSEYHITLQAIRRDTPGRTATVDTDLFLACYTLYTGPHTLIAPSAASLPMPQAQLVRSKATPDAFARLREFFDSHPDTKHPDAALLGNIARYLTDNDYPPELILHPPSTAPDAPPRVPLPELFAGLAKPDGSKWPDILRAIRHGRDEGAPTG